jgi:predicted DNA-binding protein
MERINLNVPSDVRKRLRAVAKSTGKTEAETARELLVAALDRAERAKFYEDVAAAQTAAVRDRMLVVHEALERLSG